MIKLYKMLKKESQAGTKAEQRKNDEGLTSSPACTKPTVVRSPNIVSTEKDAETGYTITNQSTNQTLDLDGQIVVYLGHRHLHMSATELVEIILKRADELAPKVGVRQKFARLNNKDEFIISYGVKLSSGEIEFEDD